MPAFDVNGLIVSGIKPFSVETRPHVTAAEIEEKWRFVMASGEKTGFVIGLLFIFVVAWALNGIPHSGETTGSKELTAAMVSRPIGIRPKLQQEFFRPRPIQQQPGPEASPPKQNNRDAQQTSPAEPYMVQEGDTLWRIAARQLGDGRRYKEIVELNAGLADDENSLAVGTQLIIPAR